MKPTVLCLLACVCLSGCLGQEEPRGNPTAEVPLALNPARQQATQPGYVPPAGWRTECVGYHLVDLPGEIEAATEPVTENAYEQIGGGQFSQTLAAMQDGYDNGEFTVEVSDPTTREAFERRIETKYYWSDIQEKYFEPADIQRARREVEQYKRRLREREEWLRQKKSNPNYNGPHITEEGVQSARDSLQREEQYIKDWESIPEIWVDKDSYYYGGWLWLWRSPRIYRLRMKQDAIPAGQTRQEATLALLSRFQPRQLGEIPPEAGFCVPFGFVRGVSNHPYVSQTTLRLKSEPGLLYTVGFERDGLTSMAAMVGTGRPQGIAPREIEEPVRLGPFEASLSGYRARPYRQEALPGGGVKVELFKNGDPYWVERKVPQGEIYALETRYIGEKGDPLLPSLQVQINGFAFNADPQMQDRPVMALDEALPVIKQFLASIRLREENAQAFEKGE